MTTSHIPAIPPTRRRLSAGPVAHLDEIPDPADATLGTPDEIDEHLRQVEAARQLQLAALPAADLDVVASAHRARVEQILTEVRAARARLASGQYGVCTGCHTAIPPERLELRPYTPTCAPCARWR